MKQRSTFILLGTLIVLGFVSYLFLRPSKEREATYSLAGVDLSVDSSQIRSISIVRGDRSVTLQNTGGLWYVVRSTPDEWRYPADEYWVEQLVAGLHGLRVVSPISSNPEKQHLFEVDTTGTQLIITDRKGDRKELIVGKPGTLTLEVYVRPANSNDVYLVQGLNPFELNKEPKDWRDKRMALLAKDSIREVAFSYETERFSLEKDSVWRLNPPAPNVDETKVNDFLAQLVNVRATDFVDSTIQISLPRLRLEIAAPDRVTMLFAPVPPDTAHYYVTSSTSSQIFLLNKWTAQALFKTRKDFVR
jgi:hypothetical protein